MSSAKLHAQQEKDNQSALRYFFEEEHALRRGERMEDFCKPLGTYIYLREKAPAEHRDEVIRFARSQYIYAKQTHEDALKEYAKTENDYNLPDDDTSRLGFLLRYAAYAELDLSRGSPDWQLFGTTRHRFIKLAESMVTHSVQKMITQHRDWLYTGSGVVDFTKIKDGLSKLSHIKGKDISIYDFTGMSKSMLDQHVVDDYMHGVKKLAEDRFTARAFNQAMHQRGSYSSTVVPREGIEEQNLQSLCDYFAPDRKTLLDAFNKHGDFSKPRILAGKIVLKRREINTRPVTTSWLDMAKTAITSGSAPKAHIYS